MAVKHKMYPYLSVQIVIIMIGQFEAFWLLATKLFFDDIRYQKIHIKNFYEIRKNKMIYL